MVVIIVLEKITERLFVPKYTAKLTKNLNVLIKKNRLDIKYQITIKIHATKKNIIMKLIFRCWLFQSIPENREDAESENYLLLHNFGAT
jgi:hypothetical protein